ncbi:MAG: hypothetical protein AB9869_23000 [Verrucomicrobiia bacterium]
MMTRKRWLLAPVLATALHQNLAAQSADWQSVVWREPQVRYLLADMTLGGSVAMYRDCATREKDPDSREAIRLWDAGARVVNTNDFERRWVANKYGKDGRVMRVVLRASHRTITGREVLLSSDGRISETSVRLALGELTLGRPVETLRGAMATPDVAEALRRWEAGCRVVNTNWFEARGTGPERRAFFRHSDRPADPAHIRLNSDLPYPETNVRYFMADIALGGSIEFYRAAAERDHEMGCLEAVRRTEDGYTITNLDLFERKKVDGKTLITRRGSNERISGMDVKLSSD